MLLYTGYMKSGRHGEARVTGLMDFDAEEEVVILDQGTEEQKVQLVNPGVEGSAKEIFIRKNIYTEAPF